MLQSTLQMSLRGHQSTLQMNNIYLHYMSIMYHKYPNDTQSEPFYIANVWMECCELWENVKRNVILQLAIAMYNVQCCTMHSSTDDSISIVDSSNKTNMGGGR